MVIEFVKVKIKIVSFTKRHGVSNNIPITFSLLKIIREFMKERIERHMRNQLVTSEIQNTEKSISDAGNTEYKSSRPEVFFNK